jgi:nitrogen-specific signal transduction histidine kinase
MTAAHAVLVQTPAYLESAIAAPSAEETIRNLVHDMRQPLSSMEAIAYFLEMTLPAEQTEARQYMRRLQQLVDQANCILQNTVSDARKPCGSAPGLSAR